MPEGSTMTEDENKIKLSASMFPIKGLPDTKFKFRILKVRETIPRDNMRYIRLQQWAGNIWRKHLHCPVFFTERFGYPAFLIPEAADIKKDTIEIYDVPSRNYHIDLTDDIIEIDINDATGTERDLICKILERPFTDRLLHLRKVFWKDQWTLFFFQRPANHAIERDIINAYRGFKFNVSIIENKGPHLAVDVQTRYIGRKPLSSYSLEEREKDLDYHLNQDLNYKEKGRFLRDNGIIKFPCKYTGSSDETVSQFIIDEKESVYDYYKRVYPHLDIQPDDEVVYVQDGEGKNSWPVPSSRIFPIFPIEYIGVRKCNIKSQMSPKDRMKNIYYFLNYLKGIKYEDKKLNVIKTPFNCDRATYTPPRLEFGDKFVFDPFPRGFSSQSIDTFDKEVMKWQKIKKSSFLQKYGPYYTEPLPEVILLYPEHLKRSTRLKFINGLEEEIKTLSEEELNVIGQYPYNIGHEEQMGGSLINLAKKMQYEHPGSLIIAILWKNHDKNVHDILKNTLRLVNSQCALENTIVNICKDEKYSKNKLHNLALGILTEIGTKPWVLADPLHHDLHIGIDILYGQIGYHFLYGKGGKNIKREFGNTTTRGRTSEAIKGPTLSKQLFETISTIVSEGNDIESIAIHRDGRWWPSESEGLNDALKKLIDVDLISDNIKYAVAEIRKTHLPVRIFTYANGKFFNPLIGSHLLLDPNHVLLSTTGMPELWDRQGKTASTLLLKLVDFKGDVDILNVAEDAYKLTHLNWNAPDINLSLPVTVHWTDQSLHKTFNI